LEQEHNTSRKGGARIAAKGPTAAKPSSPVKKVLWGCYHFITVIAAIIVVGYVAFNMYVKPPEQNVDTPAPPVQMGTQQTPSSPNNPGSSAGTEDPVDEPEPLNRREGVYTIFLAATDMEGIRTDTMMLMTYDVPNQKVGVISIPRDTLTSREDGKNPKLVYGSGSAKARREEVSAMLGISIDYYIKVNIRGFVALVDYLGGVDFYVPCDMDYDDPYQNLSIHFTKGQQKLNGQQCMEVARFRKNNDGSGYSDVGRTQTQQKLLVALAKKVLSLGSLTKINGFVEIFNDYVSTDLSLSDMLYFASQAIYVDTSSGVETKTLDGRGDGVYHGHSYCYELDPEKTVETINRMINPYDRDMTLDDMNLVKADSYMS